MVGAMPLPDPPMPSRVWQRKGGGIAAPHFPQSMASGNPKLARISASQNKSVQIALVNFVAEGLEHKLLVDGHYFIRPIRG